MEYSNSHVIYEYQSITNKLIIIFKNYAKLAEELAWAKI